METNRSTPTPTPLPRDPQQLLTMGLLLGRAITALVFDRPVPPMPKGGAQ